MPGSYRVYCCVSEYIHIDIVKGIASSKDHSVEALLPILQQSRSLLIVDIEYIFHINIWKVGPKDLPEIVKVKFQK